MKKRRGSMIVEASISLPVFIIAFITLVFLIKACSLQILVFSATQDQLRKYSVDLILNVESNVKEELADEHTDGSFYDITGYMPGRKAGKIDAIERFDFRYDTQIKLPVPFVNNIFLENRILCRKWKGTQLSGEAFGFAKMQEYENGAAVFVFPHSGGKFHHDGCRYINSYSQELTLTDSIRKKYTACPLCTEGDEVNGQNVYIFKYGNSYHESDCNAVTKYVISMDKCDAQLKGYTACSVCGG